MDQVHALASYAKSKIFRLPLKPCPAAEVEAVARSDPPRSPAALLQVGAGGPHRGVVGHVVVRCEQLDLGPVGAEIIFKN